MSPYALQTKGLVKKFGGFVATNDVTLNVQAGARHALIGPNGAGKTTLINLLTGFLEPTAGQVILNDDDVTQLAQHQRVKRGLARTFQINRLFAEPNPGPVKALLAHHGLMRNELRRPMMEARADSLERLVRLHDGMGPVSNA